MSGYDSSPSLWLRAMLDARSLPRPDKRPLYQYKLTQDETNALKSALLASFRRPFAGPPLHLSGAFCLWAAHWFQQEFTGGHWGWQGAMEPIGAPNDFQLRERLVTEGLSYLGRDVRKGANGDREFLPTIVSEGGFPSRLIRNEGGWVTRYVEAVVLATSQGPNTIEAALDHADFYQTMIPQTFRAASLWRLAADLAHHVVEIRKELSDAGISEGAIEWLDGVDPKWRERLPIAAGDDAARRLVEGLVRVRPRAAVMPISCQRLLLKNADDKWAPALRLQIEGRVEDDELPGEVRLRLANTNRARILPSGLLEAKGLPALGVANRADYPDWKGWEVESFVGKRPPVVNDFPLNIDAQFVFSAGVGTAIEYVPAGGTRLTSDIAVFREEASVEIGVPSLLVLAGAGSIKDREQHLYVLAPASATLAPRDGGDFAEIGQLGDEKLFRITGLVEVAIHGDSYRVQSGSDRAEFARLEAVGDVLRGAASSYPIYRGCPRFIVHNGLLKRTGDRNSLKMRTFGPREAWRDFDARSLPLGLVEVAAVDGGAMLDRLRFLHLPPEAQIGISVPTRGECNVHVTNFSTSSLEATLATIDRTNVGAGHCFRVRTEAARPAALELRARWDRSEALLSVPVLAETLAFYDIDGRVIPSHSFRSMAALRGASIEAVSPSSAVITVLEAGRADRSLSAERYFERALPFSQVRDDVERLFAMTDELDAEVRIEAIHMGSIRSMIRVRRFDIVLEPDEDREVTLSVGSMRKLVVDQNKEVWVFGRPFGDMAGVDRKLDTHIDDTGLHWTVPDGDGPWFVYAKVDGLTRSRPLHMARTLWSDGTPSRILDAVMTVNSEEREKRVIKVLQEIGADSDDAAKRGLASFIATVDPALPLQSFDILRLLSRASDAAVRIAVDCVEAALPRVLEIDEKLPLSWFMTDPATWSAAFARARSDYEQRLLAGNIPKAAQFANDLIRNRIVEIARLRPTMAVHAALVLKSLSIAVPEACGPAVKECHAAMVSGAPFESFLRDCLRDASSRLRGRNGDRHWPVPLDFRKLLPNLPTTKFEASNLFESVIDAPCAAASVALRKIEWSLELERAIRTCRAFDPAYFDEALRLALTIGCMRSAAELSLAS